MANAGLSAKEQLALLLNNNNNNNNNNSGSSGVNNATNKPAGGPVKPAPTVTPKPTPSPSTEAKPGVGRFKPANPSEPTASNPRPGTHPDKSLPANKPAFAAKPGTAAKLFNPAKPASADGAAKTNGSDVPLFPKLRLAGTTPPRRVTAPVSKQPPVSSPSGAAGVATDKPALTNKSQVTGAPEPEMRERGNSVVTPLKPMSVQDRLTALRQNSQSEVETVEPKSEHHHPNSVSPTTKSTTTTTRPIPSSAFSPAKPTVLKPVNRDLPDASAGPTPVFPGIKRSGIAKTLPQAADRVLRSKTAAAAAPAATDGSEADTKARHSHLFQRCSDEEFRQVDVSSVISSEPAPALLTALTSVDLKLFPQVYATAKVEKLRLPAPSSEPEEKYDDCQSAKEETTWTWQEPLPEEPDEIYEPLDKQLPEDLDASEPEPTPPPLPSPNTRDKDKENKDKEEAATRRDKAKEEASKEEEKERKKREDLNKMRRKFGLNDSDDKVGDGVVKTNAGRGVFSKDLAVVRGETVAILRVDSNPAGKWLVQNEQGKLGYVNSNNIEISTQAIRNSSSTESKLAAAENKLSKLETSEEEMPTDERIKDLRTEVTQLKEHLKSLQGQLKAARQQVDHYKAIAEGVEQSLRPPNQTTKEFQEACKSKMLEAQNAKSALEKRVEQLEKDHQELLTENIRITEDSHNLNNDLRKQLASLRHELQGALQARESAVAEQTAAQQALKKQVDLASEAQDKYQRELMLHSADVESLTALKKELENHSDDLAKAQSETEGEKQKLLNAQTSWQEVERLLREESRQLEARCNELEKQNRALHSQMETLSNQAIAMQQKAADDSQSLTLSEEAAKSSEQLLEVVKFLQHQKELAETKLEVAESSSTCLQQRLTVLQKQLDETMQALSEEREQNQASVQTMAQHMELMRKVETVNLLQESNKLLREENNHMQAKQHEMETKVRRLEEEISPLQAFVRETAAQKEVLEMDKKTLAAEVEQWKSCTHRLVEQGNKTDPEEHRKLVQEKDQIRKQLAQAKEELFRVWVELDRVNGVVTSKETELKNQREEMNKKMEELQETKRLLDEEQKEGEKNTTTINQLKKIGHKYKEQSEAIQKEVDQLKAASVDQQTRQSLVTTAAEQANKQLTDRLAAMKREREEVKAKMGQKETEVAFLKEQIQKIQRQLSQHEETLLKQQEENARLQSDNTGLQTENAELKWRQMQSCTVLRNARANLIQQKEEIDHLNSDLTGLRKNMASGASSHQVSKEESEQQLAALRSQYQQQVTQLQNDLEEARRGSGLVAAGASLEQLQQEKDKLAMENSELQNKHQTLLKQQEENARLQSDNTRLQTENAELNWRLMQSCTVLQNAHTKITQQKEQIDRLNSDLMGLRKNMASGASSHQVSKEESEQKLAALRSQYQQQVTQLQNDLEEARRGSGLVAAGAPLEQLQQEKDKLVMENSELLNKHQTLLKQQEENARLQSDNTRLQTENAELNWRLMQSCTVLQNAHTKITQQKEQIDRLNSDLMGLRKNMASGASSHQVSKEESEQKLAALRSQYQQQVTQLQNDLEEARRGSGLVAAGASLEQLQQEKDKLVMENSELLNKVQQLQRQVEMISKATPAHPTQPMPRQATCAETSPTATALAMQHTSSQAKAAARIRPMAIASANTPSTTSLLPPYPSSSSTPPIVTVMPTTVLQAEPQPDVEPSMSVEETTTQAVVAPSTQEPLHSVQPSQQQPLQMAAPPTSAMPASMPGPSTSAAQPIVRRGKRGREEMDISDDELEAKRSKTVTTQEPEEMEEEEFDEDEEEQQEEFDEDEEEQEEFDEDEEEQQEMDEEGMLGEGAREEEDDNDVVIDINETETPAASQEDSAASGVSATTSSPRPPPPPLQPVPAHTECLPSTSRQLTPSLLGEGGAFEEHDCMVPSTPTLSMPRRNDGFAEALNEVTEVQEEEEAEATLLEGGAGDEDDGDESKYQQA